ncbi:MAG: RNA pseudouridine synthase [Planctomycetota bacterium]
MSRFLQVNLIAELGPCLLINKPGGLLTQGPPGIDSLEFRIKSFLKERDLKPGKVYLGVPHRLDRPASGIMVFAKHVRAARRLAEQFQNRQIEKKYWAVIDGYIESDSGTWIDWMRKIPDEARSEICEPDDEGAQKAILHFRVLERRENKTWLEIKLETGRTHQIRLQTSSRGCPIVGDLMYGSEGTFGPETFDQRQRWIALHSRLIGFEHPMTQESHSIEAPVWEYWQDLGFEFPSGYDQV